MKHDVVVIGAGVIGVCTALALQKKAVQNKAYRVLLIDRDKPAAGASFGNAGAIVNGSCVPTSMPGILNDVLKMIFKPRSPLSIRPSYLHKVMPWLIRFINESRTSLAHQNAMNLYALSKHSVTAWRELTDQTTLENLLGEGGWLKVYESKNTFDSTLRARELMTQIGTQYEILNRTDIRDLEPNLAPIYESGIFQKDCLNILDTAGLVEGLVEQFLKMGGEYKKFSVEEIQVTQEFHRLKGQGDELLAENVVLATGAAARKLARQMGDNIPLEAERGYHMMFPVETKSLLSRPVVNGGYSFVLSPMETGIRMTSQVEFAGVDGVADHRRIRRLMPEVKRMLPDIELKEESVWMGCRPSLPDSLPVIGFSNKSKKLIYAFGHQHLGMTLGAITGLLVADQLTTGSSSIDIKPYRANRF